MKNRFYMCLAAAAVMAVSCVKEKAEAVPEQPVQPEEQEVEAVVHGQAYVKFTGEMAELIEDDLAAGSIVTKSSPLNAVSASLGVTSMKRVFPHAGEFEPRTRAAGLHRWYIVEYDENVAYTKASGDMSVIDGVEIVEPVRRIRGNAIFNDPKLSSQWHYYNDGAASGYTAGADINVMPVWETYTTGNPDVIVAVVDQGVDASHEDLAANYIGGYNFVQSTTKVVVGDHGTHVAGTIAAVNNNGKGVCGIAGGDAASGQKGVGILSCQIFEPDPNDPTKSVTGNTPQAIKWGADNGAVISQNSWGYVYDKEEDAAAASIPGVLKDAIDYFIQNAGCDKNGNQTGPMKGGVVIFASGNDGWAHNPIGKYDAVISVGAIGPDCKKAYYSNYGDWVDIAAPGGSADFTGGQIVSTLAGNAYGSMQGTSMACPHVSGVAALVVSHFGGPGFTNEMLKSKLLGGANSAAISKNNKIGPLVDAFGAMTYGGTKPPKAVASIDAQSISNNISMKWAVPTDPDDVKAYGFVVIAGKDREAVASADPASPAAGLNVSSVMTGSLKAGDEISATIGKLEFEHKYYVAVAAFDYNRNYSALSAVYEVETGANNPPVIETAYDGDFKVKSHEILKVTYTLTEPDGHTLAVSLDSASPAVTGAMNPDGTYTVTITGNADEPGKYDFALTVSDEYGLATVVEHSCELLENHAPAIVKDMEDVMLDRVGAKLQFDMSEYLEDPDGEQLKFSISITNPKVLHINPSDNVLHATSLSYGVTDVSIVASDSRGLTCTLTFKVLVKDPSKPLEMYPNPVTDYLNISTLDVVPTTIRIVSSTGKTVYDATSDVGAVEPAVIDMRACAPGVYNVTVSFSGETYNRNIVKL